MSVFHGDYLIILGSVKNLARFGVFCNKAADVLAYLADVRNRLGCKLYGCPAAAEAENALLATEAEKLNIYQKKTLLLRTDFLVLYPTSILPSCQIN